MLAQCLSGLTKLQNLELESMSRDSQSGASTGMNGCYALAQEAAKLDSLLRLNLKYNEIHVETKKRIMSLERVKSGKLQVLLDAEEIRSVIISSLDSNYKLLIDSGGTKVSTASCFSEESPQSPDTGTEIKSRSKSAAQLVCGDLTRGSVIISGTVAGTSKINFVDLLSNEDHDSKPHRIVRAECCCRGSDKGYYELKVENICSDWRFGFVALSLWPLPQFNETEFKKFEEKEFKPYSFSFDDGLEPLSKFQNFNANAIIGLGCDLAEKKIWIEIWDHENGAVICEKTEKPLSDFPLLQGLCPAFTCSTGGILSCSLGGWGTETNTVFGDRKFNLFEAMGMFLPPPSVTPDLLSSSCIIVQGSLRDNLLKDYSSLGLKETDTLYVEGTSLPSLPSQSDESGRHPRGLGDTAWSSRQLLAQNKHKQNKHGRGK